MTIIRLYLFWFFLAGVLPNLVYCGITYAADPSAKTQPAVSKRISLKAYVLDKNSSIPPTTKKARILYPNAKTKLASPKKQKSKLGATKQGDVFLKRKEQPNSGVSPSTAQAPTAVLNLSPEPLVRDSGAPKHQNSAGSNASDYSNGDGGRR